MSKSYLIPFSVTRTLNSIDRMNLIFYWKSLTQLTKITFTHDATIILLVLVRFHSDCWFILAICSHVTSIPQYAVLGNL